MASQSPNPFQDRRRVQSRPIIWPTVIRQAHLYLGMLIAPALLMFSVSGAFQIFRLNDARPGYIPPAIVKTLGQLHKNQQLSAPAPTDQALTDQAPTGQVQTAPAPVRVAVGRPRPGPAPPCPRCCCNGFR